MTDEREGLGTRLLALKERSGLTLDAIASSAGYRGRSSVQKMFNRNYEGTYLQPSVVERLKEALVGQGNPPIQGEELDRLTFSPSKSHDEVERISSEEAIIIAKLIRYNGFLPLDDGRHLDLFRLKPSRLYFTKPKELSIRSIVALEINVSIMYPRYCLGEIAIFDVSRTAVPGQDALCLLSEAEHDPHLATLGYVETVSEQAITLRQYGKPGLSQIPREAVVDMFPAVTLAQMLPIQRRRRDED